MTHLVSPNPSVGSAEDDRGTPAGRVPIRGAPGEAPDDVGDDGAEGEDVEDPAPAAPDDRYVSIAPVQNGEHAASMGPRWKAAGSVEEADGVALWTVGDMSEDAPDTEDIAIGVEPAADQREPAAAGCPREGGDAPEGVGGGEVHDGVQGRYDAMGGPIS